MSYRVTWQHTGSLQGPNGTPSVLGGTIISAGLVNDPFRKQQLVRDAQDVAKGMIGGEMESAALAEASDHSKIPCIMIKGIADMADGNKARHWQFLAAAASTKYLYGVLSSRPGMYTEMRPQVSQCNRWFTGLFRQPLFLQRQI